MKYITFYKFFIIFFIFLIFNSACSKKCSNLEKRKEIIFLDINSDLSSVSEYSQHFHNGAKLALKEINRSGGINGKKVLVFHRNDYLNYLEAKKALVDYKNSNILAAFGTFFSSAAEGASSGANEAKIPFLCSGYCGTMIYHKPSDYTYNLRPGLCSVLKALALEANEIENLNRWLIITYSNEEGIYAAKYFEKLLMLQLNSKFNDTTKHIKTSNKNKLDKLAFKFDHLYISPFRANQALTNNDLQSALNGVKAVLILTNGKDLQYLLDKSKLKQAFANKIVFVPFAGDPEWLSYFNDEITPENWIVTGYPWYALNDDSHKVFYNKYYNTYHLQPRYASVLGYISVYMLANSAKQINLDNPNIYELREEFNKQLSNIILEKTPLGTVSMRKDHFSSLGVFTGKLNIFTQRIISNSGYKMLLKDIRMNNIKYYENSKINVPESYGTALRKKNVENNKKIAKQFNKNVNNK